MPDAFDLGMKTTLVLLSMGIATVALPAFAANQPSFPTPANAKLVGETVIGEIREFPEQTQSKGGAGSVQEAQGIQAEDRLYETSDSYAAAVGYFDKNLVRDKFTVDSREVTHTSTVWSLKGANGNVARLAVRNTSPTTVEWIVAKSETSSSNP